MTSFELALTLNVKNFRTLKRPAIIANRIKNDLTKTLVRSWQKNVPSVTSKRVHVTKKHVLIG